MFIGRLCKSGHEGKSRKVSERKIIRSDSDRSHFKFLSNFCFKFTDSNAAEKIAHIYVFFFWWGLGSFDGLFLALSFLMGLRGKYVMLGIEPE